ncbi:hypothetical protein UlMin_034334 [Ulmus minor]
MFRNAIEGSVTRRAAVNAMADKAVVAVKADRVISSASLAWALNHVVHPGDCITLLAVLSDEKSGRKFWRFPSLAGDCASGQKENLPDRVYQISESCSQMVLQFHNKIEVTVRVKVVLSSPAGTVAAEAKSNGANWVVLDKKLKHELKHCIDELRCNIVVMKGSRPKVQRLNLGSADELETPFFSAASSPVRDVRKLRGHKMKHSTPVSSPEEPSTSFTRTTGESSFSSFNSATSVFLVYEQNPLFEGPQKATYKLINEQNNLEESLSKIDLNQEKLITLSKVPPPIASNQSTFWLPQNHKAEGKPPIPRNAQRNRASTTKSLFDQDVVNSRTEMKQNYDKGYGMNTSIRDAVSLGRSSLTPPPLCSLCQHKSPAFGKPPKQFLYRELEEATDGFSDINFLAEAGFSVVHRGVMRDGQVVAVKQLKFGGSQADADFSREVRVLSCAQHRNVVLLIGYCIEGKTRMLVYEYICNGSLDLHLHGKSTHLDWNSRVKIATGTARGLRYLHEDCRVGCIVHRDLRPNNILLTHDYDPMVADFGLARWLSEWDITTEGRVTGTLGYLAPEYVDGGQITHKVDVYAFGVVLLELITGQRITELQQKEQHFLADWFHPLATLESKNILPNYYQLLDPSLASEQSPEFFLQLEAMARAAYLCLRRDPESRPQMSKVLRVLEGGDQFVPLCLDLNTVGSRSGHLPGLTSRAKPELRISHSRKLSH